MKKRAKNIILKKRVLFFMVATFFAAISCIIIYNIENDEIKHIGISKAQTKPLQIEAKL